MGDERVERRRSAPPRGAERLAQIGTLLARRRAGATSSPHRGRLRPARGSRRGRGPAPLRTRPRARRRVRRRRHPRRRRFRRAGRRAEDRLALPEAAERVPLARVGRHVAGPHRVEREPEPGARRRRRRRDERGVAAADHAPPAGRLPRGTRRARCDRVLRGRDASGDEAGRRSPAAARRDSRSPSGGGERARRCAVGR